MTPVNVRSLRPGDRLTRAIFSRDGAKLLPRGAELTPDVCAALREYAGGVLFYSVVSARRDAAVDQRALVGEMIEEKPAHRLSAREADAIVARRLPRWDDLPMMLERAPAEWNIAARSRFEAPLGPCDDDEPFAAFREAGCATLRETFESLADQTSEDLAAVEGIADELVAMRKRDATSLARLVAPGARRIEFLPDHALTTGGLCVLIGAAMGIDERGVRLAALTGLLCDAGMAMLPAGMRIADKRLDEVEVNRVRRHPALSAAALARLGGVDERVVRAVYQHHERMDGSGYPTGARDARICELARIAAVAETYAAASAHRPYRFGPKRPHDAMIETVRAAAGGRLNKDAARALVGALGLYPPGSWVRLRNGGRAVVLAPSPRSPARAVVRVALGDALSAPIDLSNDPSLTPIAGATDAPLAFAPRSGAALAA